MRAWINQEKHARSALSTAVLLLLIFAWSNRFVQDDAFISFRYAKNLIQGLGLVWNQGEIVEGYSNFLWTLLISAGMALGFEPGSFSIFLGLTFLVLTLLFTYKMAHLVLVEPFLALIAILLLGTNYSFSAFATGGLETQMQVSLLVVATYLVLKVRQEKSWSPGELFLLGVLFSAALLTRLDSAVILSVLSFVVLYEIYRQHLPLRRTVIRLLSWLLPIIFIVGIWLIWKTSYYGSVLPNTFYVKVASAVSIIRGGYYHFVFYKSYWLLPLLLLALIYIKKIWSARNGSILILMVICFFWSLYLLYLGGDFMEFRLMTPIMPAMMILLTWLIFTVISKPVLQFAAIALILIGSIHHMVNFTPEHGIGSIPGLKGYMVKPENNWDGIGRKLGDLFDDCTDPVTIAVRPAGAIPYFSGLHSIDMLGLNDPWIAQNGYILGTVPGHQRIAPFNYLLQKGTNLIIGHPVLEADYPEINGFSALAIERFTTYLAASQPDVFPEKARFLRIPIEDGYSLIVLYLIPNTCIDEAIEKYHWGSRLVP